MSGPSGASSSTSGSSSGLTRMRRFPFHFDFWTHAREGAGRTGWTASQSGPLEGLAKHSFWPSMTSIIHRLRLYPGVAQAAGTRDEVFYGIAHYLVYWVELG